MAGFYRFLGGLGRLLIAAGVVVLLFVVYQLWGTGLREAQAQADLTERFTESLVQTPPAAEPAEPAEPVEAPVPPPTGEAVAIIQIPKIGVEKAVVEGVGVADLRKGPGHYPATPMPGQPGNAAIAGHRTTYGAPFYDLNELEVGDEILVRTLQGEFRYEVDRTSVVRPDQVEVLDQTEEARLTLTTCNPRFSAAQRLIVSAVLTGDPSARAPAIAWGALAAAIWLAAGFVARRWRRWPPYLVAVPTVLVVLFLCFENVARLFPASI